VKKYNPANRLIAVRLSSHGCEPGTVAEIEPGLWSGYVEWDAKVSAADNVPIASWEKICRTVANGG
jgi:hypothetical protein